MLAIQLLEQFARGGGGGSGGGHGGGGFGGGGYGGGTGTGTGSIAGFLFWVAIFPGYLITYFLVARVRRSFNQLTAIMAAIALIIVIGIVSLLIGHGMIGALFGAFMGAISGMKNATAGSKFAGSKQQKSTQQKIEQAAALDRAWDLTAMQTRVEQVFMQFQADWSAGNAQNLRSYMTERYALHNAYILAALKQRQRQNLVEQPQLLHARPVSMQDMPDNSQDSIVYEIYAKAHDVLVETGNGQNRQLFVDDSAFTEYWHFVRENDQWMLAAIQEQTEDASMGRPDVKAFADSMGFYYNLDWGWLLLPTRGQLFQGSHFGISDVNNHVIGGYNNLIIELYTYVKDPQVATSDRDQYVIAQVAIPKYYDSFIVAAKDQGVRGLFQRPPRGYNKLSLEWPDFNKRYVVFATNVEQVTAFELLHPVYMEKLFALPFKVSIEVVENVIYFYTKDTKADYALMYQLLQDAFKELRL